MDEIRRLSEVRDQTGSLTHKMCCVCFNMTPREECWRDAKGQTWDLCSKQCALDAGMSVE